MSYVFEPMETPSVAIAGSDQRFPVRRIFCVGRNYREHLKEMGNDPDRTPPTFFSKPADAVVADGATIPYPQVTENFHHEIELVAAIGKEAKDVAKEDALGYVWGYGVGIDLTRRDLQKGPTWDMAKGFDNSAPVSALRPVSEVGHPDTAAAAISLKVNGEVRQSSTLDEHVWNVAEVISALSRLVVLKPGDLILMGTPEGVGPLEPGDTVEGHIDGVGDLTLHIAK